MPSEKLALLKKALILLMCNAFIYIASSPYAPFLSAFYTRRGMNVGQIGILFAIGPVASLLIQPFWARYSDRTNRRRSVLLVVVAGCGISLLAYYLGRSFLTYFLISMLVSVFSTSINPLCDTLVVAETQRYRMNFAHIRLGGTIGYSIMVLIAGAVLDVFPDALFLMSTILYGLMFVAILQLPADRPYPTNPKPPQPAETEAPGDNAEERPPSPPKGVFNLFQSVEVVFILLFLLAVQIGASFYSSFLGVYMINIGHEASIGLASCIGALSEIPALLFIDRARRKFGTIPILVFCGAMTVLRLLVINGGTIGYVYLGQLLQGISYIPVVFCCVMFISGCVLPGKHSQGQSFLAMVQGGIGSIIGNVGGGQMVNRIGLGSSYLIVAVAVLCIVSCNLAAYLLHHRRKTKQPLAANG